jgi:hypothetical protein
MLVFLLYMGGARCVLFQAPTGGGHLTYLRNADFGASQIRFLLEQQNKPASL